MERIAISAPNHDSGAANRGQVRVFDFVSEEWSQVELTFWVTTQPISKGFPWI
jgi:hypothetical protein